MARDTKERILDVAEQMFAENGFRGTSLRSITAAAHVNLAAVNYHFGSKEGLIEALFARRLVPMNNERVRRLEALEHEHGYGRIPLEPLVDAFVEPALALSRGRTAGRSRFAALLGCSYTEPSPALQEAVRSMYQEMIERFMPAFAAALPELSSEELSWRLHFLVGAMAHAMSDADTMRLVASARQTEHGNHDALVRRLTTFVTAGLRAPAGATTPERPARSRGYG